jgi:amino acid adenylation domain-containing protein
MNEVKSTISLTLNANQSKKEKSYWLNKLSGHLVKNSFPFDYERDNSVPHRLETIDFSLPKGIDQKIIDLSKRSNERLFIVLMTGIFILLRKYSGSKDIVLGIPVSLPDENTTFINTALAIRCQIEDMDSFRQLLSKMRQTVIESVDNQNFPIGVLSDLLGLKRSPGGGFPLFDVVVSLKNIHHYSLHGLAPNIVVSFERNDGVITSRFSYNTGRYRPETIERLILQYQRLLRGALADPDKEISAIELLSEEDKQHILISFNDTSADFPGSTAVHELVDRQSELIPHAGAVVYKDRQLSYAGLKSQTDCLAAALRQKGVKPNQIVAVLFDHSPGMVVTLIGILKAGGAYLPIAADFPARRIEYIIRDSGARYIVTTGKYPDKTGDYRDKVLLYRQLVDNVFPAGPSPERKVNRHPRDLAYIMYTSGSTGMPKGVMIEHKSFIDFTTWAVDIYEHRRGYQVLLSNSYASDGGVQQIFPPLVSGGTLHLIDKELRLDIPRYTDYLKKNRINNIDEVPVLMNELVGRIDPDESKEMLPDLTCLSIGSEYVPIELVRKCRKCLNRSGRIINGYGPAETSVETTIYYFDGTSDSEISLIGKPRRNTRVYILDEAGNCCPIGVRGEICISGVGLARGYINKPGLTAQKFVMNPHSGIPGDRIYKTGDQGCWLQDGNIRFFGRIDDQIKVRGYRVELSEIEQVLKGHEGIKDAAAVTGVNNEGETEICAYYVDDTRKKPVVWPSVGEYPLYDDYVYYAMTNDEARNAGYKEAIRQKVEDKVVVEIGTGKDVILARFCVEAGARKIYAIELSGDSFKKARQTVEKLGLQDKIILIHGDAAKVEIPGKGDVCLSEVIGTIGGSEGAAAILKSARRFLKEDGVMIPDKCITKIAAVQLPPGLHETPAFSRMSARYVDVLYQYSGYPFNFRICVDNFPKSSVISGPGVFEDLDFSGQIETGGKTNVELVIVKDGRMDGFLLWLNLHTTPGEVIDNLENRHCWAPVFVPVTYPGVTVSRGDRIRLTCSRSLSRNGVNPDYRLEGTLTLEDGTDISLRYGLPYCETDFLKNPFYEKLLVNNPAGYVRNIHGDSGVSELRRYLEERLPSYMVPGHLIELERIPLTPNGKVDKKALPGTGKISLEGYVPPRNILEKKLASIWAEVLARPPETIGIYSDFFKMGGHSLKANILTFKIRKQLDVDMPLIQLFKTPTFIDLAKYLNEAKKNRYTPIKPVELREYYALTPVQKRLYILQQIEPGSTAYNVPGTITLDKRIDKERLEEIFKKLIYRHEILRTSFELIHEEPVQRIHAHAHPKIEYFDGIKEGNREKEKIENVIENVVKPFDLETAPLFRAGLICMENRHVLVVDMHHIICDPISHEVLFEEFNALSNRQGLPGVRLHYKDYSAFPDSEEQKAKMKRQESYWLQLYSGEYTALDLPADFPRPPIMDFEGASLNFILEEGRKQKLKKVAADHDVTFFMLILAIFNILLSKLGGQEDIIVGTPVSTRLHPDIEKMIGMFVNTLAMRNYPAGHKTVKDYLQEVKTQTLKAYNNREYPFEELVDKISLKRDTGRNSLFDVMFNLLNGPDSPGDLLEIDEKGLYRHRKGTAKFDMTLRALDFDDRVLFNLEYRTRLFKPGTIDRIIDYFKNIAASVTGNPAGKIKEIELISAREKREILVRFNRELKGAAGIGIFQHKLFESFRQYPDKVAVEYGTIQVTYAELEKRAALISCWLIHHGIEKESFIGIYLDDRIDIIASMIGILEAGAVFVPLDTVLPAKRVRGMVRLVNPRAVFTGKVYKEKLITGSRDTVQNCEIIDMDVSFYRECERLSPTEPGIGYTGDDKIYIYFTSGSTGTPKAIIGRNGSLLHFVGWEIDTFAVTPGSRVSQLAAVGFDAFLRNVFTPLCAGGVVCIPGNRELVIDGQALADWIDRHGIYLIHCIPGVFRLLHTESLTAAYFKNLKYILLSGDVVNPVDLEKWYNVFADRVQLVNCYGTTETTVIKTYHPIRKSDARGERIPIGKPISGTGAVILDENLNVCGRGMVGRIYLRTPYSTWGYHNDCQLNKEKFIPNPFTGEPSDLVFRTGDLGRLLEDGSLEFLGRKDRQVKIRGVRIELDEIAHQLRKHPHIKDTVAVSKRREEPFICAYFVSAKELSAYELREYLGRELPAYMIPSYFVQIERLPLSPNGKVDIRALPGPEAGAVGMNYTAPRNKTEEILAAIWSGVLAVEKEIIGIDDDFFELGGNSLNATITAAKIHRSLKVKVPLTEMFKAPRIRALSQYIHEAERDRSAPLEPVEKKEYYPLSSAQKRLFILHQMGEAAVVYNMPVFLELRGFLDKDGLESTFLELIDRHESLRTSFLLVDDKAVQRIHHQVEFEIEYHLPTDFVRPFDLTRPPLIRLGLTHMEENRHLLVIDMHHIISDGVSQDILVKDFTRFYPGKASAPLRIQYKDFSEWQNREKKNESIKSREKYWINEFMGELPMMDLPVDFARPLVQGFEGDTIEFALNPGVTEALKQLAKEKNVTLFMVLLASYNIFLSKISGQEYVIVGTPTAGRKHADLQPIMGMFVNTLALRSFPRGKKTFTRFLQEVKVRSLHAFENQDYPYEELVNAVAVNRDPGRNPLFDTMFTFQNMAAVELEIPGLSLQPYPYNNKTAKFDLSLTGGEVGDNIVFALNYCTKLFRQVTIERFIRFFKRTLFSILENPRKKLAGIDIIPEEEKRQILFDFNDTAVDFPGTTAVHELVDRQAQRTPHADAVVYRDQRLSYAELKEKTGRLGAALKQKGVGPGQIIAVLFGHSPAMVVTLIGILKSWGAYLPVDPDFPVKRIEYIIRDSSAKYIITPGKYPDQTRDFQEKVLLYSQLVEHPSILPPSTIKDWDHQPHHPAYIMYTSGSTGVPKGVMIEHRSFIDFTTWAVEAFEHRSGYQVLLSNSYASDGSIQQIFPPLVSGGTLHLVDKELRLDISRYLDYLRKHRINNIDEVPVLMNELVGQIDPGDREEKLPDLTCLSLGSEYVPIELARKCREHLNHSGRIINAYGPAEATVETTAYWFEGTSDSEISLIGKPRQNIRVYVLDEGGNCSPPGVRGEICISGVGLSRGYLNKPGLTARKFVLNRHSGIPGDRLYKTGDQGCWLPDGNIRFFGRIDEQVKIRGYRIEPGEIENQLLRHDAIKEAVVAAKTNKKGDKYLCAYIVSDPGIAVPGLKELRKFLSLRLPEHMIPSYLVPIKNIPLTPNGKVDTRALPEPGFKAAGSDYTAPRNKIEKRLVEIWSEVLALEEDVIGIDDHFFERGGNSLSAAAAAAKIYKLLKVKVTLTEFFKAPRIRESAQYIKEAEKGEYASIEPGEKKEYYAVSSAQKRLYILQQMELESTAYNMPLVFELEGFIDTDRLEGAFLKLINRHESLRTSFYMLNNRPVQEIHDEVTFEIQYYQDENSRKENCEFRSPGYQVQPDYKLKITHQDQFTASLIKNFIIPFDLADGPLFRVGLRKITGKSHLVMVDIHHIISDAFSCDIMIKDFTAIFVRRGLPPLRIQYTDFSRWQNSEKQKEYITRQGAYWVKQFEGEIPVLNLPFDFARPRIQDYEGSILAFELNSEETGQLKKLALEENLTLFMVLLSLLDMLLSRLSSQEDIVVGAPVAGRVSPDLEHMIGIFVNTLALRNYPSGEKSFRRFLREVKEKTLSAFENQEYQFEELVEKLPITRDTGRNPLFDAALDVLNIDMPLPDFEIGGPNLKPYPFFGGISKFDLVFHCEETGDRLSITVDYAVKLFKENTIRRFINYFKRIVSQVIDNKDIIIDRVDILSKEEKEEILNNFNVNTSAYSREKTLHRLFEEQVEKNPDNTAVVGGGAGPGARDPGARHDAPLLPDHVSITYKELNKKSNQLAYLLREKGVGPDNIAAIMMKPSLERIIAILAVLKAGGAYLPIDHTYPTKRIRFMLEDCKTKILAAGSDVLENHSFTALQGIEGNSHEGLIVTAPRTPIADFGAQPLVDRTTVDYDKYSRYIGMAMVKQTITLQGTRGCPYHCAYCHKIWPRKHVFRSAEHIFKEVRLYYNLGVRRFVFIDDIFNLNIRNSRRFFRMIIDNGLKVQLFFPNGLRGDILTGDYIDLMVEAGTVNIALALETASPRLQKMIGKNLNIEKLRENLEYICRRYPQVLLELFTMHGFPSETEDEALQTLNFIKGLKWLHFPYFHILKIYPSTDMAALAREQGIPEKIISQSADLAYHQPSDTLPFDKGFTRKCQADFLNRYFLAKERLRHVLPYQMKLLSEDELVQKYNSYLPVEIKTLQDLLEFAGPREDEPALSGLSLFCEARTPTLVPDLSRRIQEAFSQMAPAKNTDANISDTSEVRKLRVLLLDLSQLFTKDKHKMLYDVVEPPLGLMYLMTALKKEFGKKIAGKIAKSRIDFDNYSELRQLLTGFKPDIVGLRTLTYYKDFFHRTAAVIRQWSTDVPLIAGGPYATGDYASLLNDKNIELAVLGEGERTLCDIVSGLLENDGKLPGENRLKNIPGIAFVRRRREQLPAPTFAREVMVVDALPFYRQWGFGRADNNGKGENLADINRPGDAAYVIYTSGTTGIPRGVMVTHGNITGLMTAGKDLFRYGSQDVWTMFHSYCFDFSVWEMYGALLFGGKGNGSLS